MAKSRLNYVHCVLLGATFFVYACQGKHDAAQKAVSSKAPVPKTVPNWLGLPLTPGLPVELDALRLGMGLDTIDGKYAELLTPEGYRLSDKATARAVVSKSGTLRYLVVSVSVSPAAVVSRWPGSTVSAVDFRASRTVWLLESKRLQVHLNASENGGELTYIPLTPITTLVGPPTGTGRTFGSYVGKPLAAVKPMFVRLSEPKTNGSRFGWAHPLPFETVSLKSSIKLAVNGESIERIDLFLKDDLAGRLRTEIESEAAKYWSNSSEKNAYTQSGVTMKITQIPQLGLRKRTHKNVTLSFYKTAKPTAKQPETTSPLREPAARR